jgi:hypothetical protein
MHAKAIILTVLVVQLSQVTIPPHLHLAKLALGREAQLLISCKTSQAAQDMYIICLSLLVLYLLSRPCDSTFHLTRSDKHIRVDTLHLHIFSRFQ